MSKSEHNTTNVSSQSENSDHPKIDLRRKPKRKTRFSDAFTASFSVPEFSRRPSEFFNSSLSSGSTSVNKMNLIKQRPKKSRIDKPYSGSDSTLGNSNRIADFSYRGSSDAAPENPVVALNQTANSFDGETGVAGLKSPIVVFNRVAHSTLANLEAGGVLRINDLSIIEPQRKINTSKNTNISNSGSLKETPSFQIKQIATSSKDLLKEIRSSRTPQTPISNNVSLRETRASKTPQTPISKNASLRETRASRTPQTPILNTVSLRETRASRTPQTPILNTVSLRETRASRTPQTSISKNVSLRETRAPRTPQTSISKKVSLRKTRSSLTPKTPTSKNVSLRGTRASRTPQTPSLKTKSPIQTASETTNIPHTLIQKKSNRAKRKLEGLLLEETRLNSFELPREPSLDSQNQSYPVTRKRNKSSESSEEEFIKEMSHSTSQQNKSTSQQDKSIRRSPESDLSERRRQGLRSSNQSYPIARERSESSESAEEEFIKEISHSKFNTSTPNRPSRLNRSPPGQKERSNLLNALSSQRHQSEIHFSDQPRSVSNNKLSENTPKILKSLASEENTTNVFMVKSMQHVRPSSPISNFDKENQLEYSQTSTQTTKKSKANATQTINVQNLKKVKSTSNINSLIQKIEKKYLEQAQTIKRELAQKVRELSEAKMKIHETPKPKITKKHVRKKTKLELPEVDRMYKGKYLPKKVKLLRPAWFINKPFHNFFLTHMAKRHGEEQSIVKTNEFIQIVDQFVRRVERKSWKYNHDEVLVFEKILAKEKIVRTHWQFHRFVRQWLTDQTFKKIVPYSIPFKGGCSVPSYDTSIIFQPILSDSDE